MEERKGKRWRERARKRGGASEEEREGAGEGDELGIYLGGLKEGQVFF